MSVGVLTPRAPVLSRRALGRCGQSHVLFVVFILHYYYYYCCSVPCTTRVHTLAMCHQQRITMLLLPLPLCVKVCRTQGMQHLKSNALAESLASWSGRRRHNPCLLYILYNPSLASSLTDHL